MERIIDNVYPEPLFKRLVSIVQRQYNSWDYNNDFGRYSKSTEEGGAFLIPYLNKSVDLAQNIFKSTTLKGSYSLAAVYKNDYNTIPNLPHHKDNNACTYTIDVCLFQKEPWSIWVEDKEYFLKPNQAIIIYGEEEEHWREKFPNPETNIVGMLFNHYVEPDHWWNTGKRIDNSE